MFSRVTTTIILAKGIHFVFFRTGNNSNWQIVGLQVVFQSIFGLQFSLKKVLHGGGEGVVRHFIINIMNILLVISIPLNLCAIRLQCGL